MAQKTEKEEKVVPETISPCGVTGTPSTAAATEIHQKFAEKPARSGFRKLSPERSSPDLKRLQNPTIGEDENRSDLFKREVNRCSGCRKKVGLTGFRCRCGELFCGEHRYSDRHDCSFDYKAAGRDAIARENPIVKAAKIVKI